MKYKVKTFVYQETHSINTKGPCILRASIQKNISQKKRSKTTFCPTSLRQKGYVANFNDENYQSWKLKRSNFFDMFVVEMNPLVKDFEPLFEVKSTTIQNFSRVSGWACINRDTYRSG